MIIGVVGAPNKGKSTFFSAACRVDVKIADYPFTTIDPNKAVTYLQVQCPSVELGIKSQPRIGKLENGMREIPIQLVDVAGLVEGAYEGKGMGNKFLDDLSNADGFLHIIDASGKTDLYGQPAIEFDMQKEIEFLENEMRCWILGILKKNSEKIKGRDIGTLITILSGLKYSQNDIEKCVRECKIDQKRINADETELERLSFALIKCAKPKVIVANKADAQDAIERIEKFKKDRNVEVVTCSAQYENILQNATKNKYIKYFSSEDKFEVCKTLEPKQKQALEMIEKFLQKNKGTGVHRAIQKLVFEKIQMIVVYPVENETLFSDSKGRVLPDAILMPKGSTVMDLARKIHQEIADKFIGAIDAKQKRQVAKDYQLKNGDIIKIIRGM